MKRKLLSLNLVGILFTAELLASIMSGEDKNITKMVDNNKINIHYEGNLASKSKKTNQKTQIKSDDTSKSLSERKINISPPMEISTSRVNEISKLLSEEKTNISTVPKSIETTPKTNEIENNISDLSKVQTIESKEIVELKKDVVSNQTCIEEELDEDEAIPISGYLVPTYESIGYYFDCEECDRAYIYYRQKGTTTWKKAYEPVYSEEMAINYQNNIASGQYRGSIVYLKENTNYEVKLETFIGGKLSGRYICEGKTWTSNVRVEKEVILSKLLGIKDKIGSLTIYNCSGKDNAWLKVNADIKIDAVNSRKNVVLTYKNGTFSYTIENGSREAETALLVSKSKYVIIDGANVNGGQINGSRLTNDSSYIRMLNANISNYGRVPKYRGAYNVGYDTNGNLINYDSGVCFEASSSTIEKCYIHDPRGSANAWDKSYAGGSHPAGPNAIYVRYSEGNNVIRNNILKGSRGHRFNDVIEGWYNGYKGGGLYKDCDIYKNEFAYGNDDGIELDGGQMNVRLFENKIHDVLAGVSVMPNMLGPSYIFRNEVANLGDENGRTNYCIKSCGGTKAPKYGYTFIFNNTLIAKTHVYATYSNTTYGAYIVTRNNICYTSGWTVFNNAVDVTNSDFDYDLLYNLMAKGKCPISNKTIHEKHSIIAEPQLEANYHLKASSPAVNKGIYLDNFTENYKGSAPDIGAYESY